MGKRRRLDLVPEILALIRQHQLAVGASLHETRLAQQLNVSRAPVRAALQHLQERGILEKSPRRGYLLKSLPSQAGAAQAALTETEALYTALAMDHFDERIPQVISEQELQRRYGCTAASLRTVLARVVAEGWAIPRKGYGWQFLEVLRHPDAYAQIMRMRQAIEPVGLLEPGFSLPPATLNCLRERQLYLLDEGVTSLSVAELFQDGCAFHEALAQASGNIFLLDALKRLNAIRRLFTYRSIIPRHEYLRAHIREHLHLLALIESGALRAASDYLRVHLQQR